MDIFSQKKHVLCLSIIKFALKYSFFTENTWKVAISGIIYVKNRLLIFISKFYFKKVVAHQGPYEIDNVFRPMYSYLPRTYNFAAKIWKLYQVPHPTISLRYGSITLHNFYVIKIRFLMLGYIKTLH